MRRSSSGRCESRDMQRVSRSSPRFGAQRAVVADRCRARRQFIERDSPVRARQLPRWRAGRRGSRDLDENKSREHAMATVINLNRFRKAKKRSVAEERAAQNRAASGRTKKERKTTTRECERADRELDNKRLD